jgi:hypothetical protein
MEGSRDERAWFSGLADALAQAVVDARGSASACEELLESARTTLAPADRQRLIRTIVLPAAISGVLVDLADRPPALVLAAARVCRETSLTALEQLALHRPPLDYTTAAAALRRSSDSCGRLLAAADRG